MRAIVIGGGIGGLTAAIALKRVGHDVRVFEQAPQIQEVGAGLSLWSNAVNALDRLGIAERVVRIGSIFRYGKILTDKGAILTTTDVHEINSNVPCVLVHRGELQRELLEALGSDSVTTNAECVRVTQSADSVQAEFADGSRVDADFLVGADGINSTVRTELLGPSARRYSGCTCWRGVVHVDPLDLDEATAAWVLGRGFQMGVFRCGVGRVYWFFSLVVPRDGKDDPAGRRDFLMERVRGGAPLMTSVLEATANDQIIRTDLCDRRPAWPWGVGRVTLLGDAIHPTTPNLGQGACQAIESAVYLADAIAQDSPVESALRNYERRRRQRTAMVTKTSWQLGRLCAIRNPLLVHLRNVLLRSPLVGYKASQVNRKLLTHQFPELVPAPGR